MVKPELELYLVRHGESMGNIGAWEGENIEDPHDPPLTEKGVRQAELLGEMLADLPLDYIYVSGLRRALQTATEIASRQPENGVKTLRVHKLLSECEIDETAIGRTMEEIQEEFPFCIPAEDADSTERVIWHSKGATDAEHLERAKEVLSLLRARYHNGEKVMVVAHAAFNTFLLFAALGLSYDLHFDPSFYNTGVTKVDFFKKGEGPYADTHLVYHNAVPHLASEMPEFRF